jgi:diacylglycerol kinase (ATP)
MKHVFIINPTAGKSDSRQKIYDMAEKLRQEHGLEVQCLLTKKQGHATEIARRLCQSGEELRFYACGGDGTVNEVANGIIGYDNASMTVIPVGTGNDFLKNFGPEDLEKFRDAENLWDAPQFPIDAIDVNGRIALTIACSGIDARVAKDVHNFSESPILDGKSSYIVSLMVNFLFKGIGSHWTVELDGEAVEDDYALVAVCNGRYYGGGFMPVAEARMDDGVLNTLVVKKVSRLTFMKFVNPYSKGQYYKFPHLARCSTPKVIRIRSEKPDIVTCLDGECITSDDVTIQLSDKRLNFFGPAGCSCNRTARKPRI